VTQLEGDRKRLYDDYEKLKAANSQKDIEYNQLLAGSLMVKQQIVDQFNQANTEQEGIDKKKKQFEEERRQFEENKAKFFSLIKSGNNSKNINTEMQDILDDSKMDLKVFYVQQSKEQSKLLPIKKTKVHASEIYALTDNYFGDLIGSSAGDCTFKIFDPRGSEIKQTKKSLNPSQLYTSLCFGKDNDSFLTGSTDKIVHLWSLKSVQQPKATFNGHSDRVSCVVFAHDLEKCVSGSHDRSLKMWDTHKGSIIKTILSGSSVYDLQITSDKSRIISAHNDRTVKIYSAKTGENIRVFKDIHEASITSVCLSADNNLVLTASRDNTCRLIDLRMDKVLSLPFKHENYASSCDYSKVCFGNYDKSVVAGGKDGKIYTWNVDDGKIQDVASGQHEGFVTMCRFNVVSGLFYTADSVGNVVVWQ